MIYFGKGGQVFQPVREITADGYVRAPCNKDHMNGPRTTLYELSRQTMKMGPTTRARSHTPKTMAG